MKRPNILLLFTDMQRADTIRALGNEVIQTPALDRLVREGTSFTRCYSPSPVCVPARCSMHYGIYPQKTGVFDNEAMMPDNGRSLPALLATAGYRTVAVGKCHFTPDAQAKRGFDERVTQEEIVNDYARDDYRSHLVRRGLNPAEAHGERGPMYYIPQPSRFQNGDHPTEWIADRSIEKIRELEAEGSPWFMMSSFIHPHPPLTPPTPWTKLYPPDTMPAPFNPENRDELLTYVNHAQNRFKWRDNGRDRNLERMIQSYYYATISYVDYQIGRMLRELEDRGILDDTLILFSSDHGEYLGDYGCYGKRSMHDASARVPFIVRQPGVFPADKRIDEPTSLVDVLPTMLAAAGAEADDCDGVALQTVAAGRSDRQFVYSQFGKGRRAIYLIASVEWKYIYSAGDGKELLFARSDVPAEGVNRIEDASAEAAHRELKAALLQYLHSEGDDEAVEADETALRWRDHPPLNMDYLRSDPDAGLLYQDEAAGLPENIRGYAIPRQPGAAAKVNPLNSGPV